MPVAPSLREAQESIARAILGGGLGGLAIAGGGCLSPERALAVYREGYYARLTGALGETFEAVWSVLGDAAFFALCRDFISVHRSVHYSLSAYGEGLGPFLADRPEAGDRPFLPELCAFEWTFHELFHRREHARAEPAALSRAGGDCRLVLGGAVVLRRHARAVSMVWAGRKEGKPLPRAAWDTPERVLLYKRDADIFVERLGEGEFSLLEGLSRGLTLAGAVARAGRADPGLDPGRVGALFAMIASSGIVERVEYA